VGLQRRVRRNGDRKPDIEIVFARVIVRDARMLVDQLGNFVGFAFRRFAGDTE